MNDPQPISNESVKKAALYSIIGISMLLMAVAFIVYQVTNQKKDESPIAQASKVHKFWINDFNKLKGKPLMFIPFGDDILELGVILKDNDVEAQVICRPVAKPNP